MVTTLTWLAIMVVLLIIAVALGFLWLVLVTAHRQRTYERRQQRLSVKSIQS